MCLLHLRKIIFDQPSCDISIRKFSIYLLGVATWIYSNSKISSLKFSAKLEYIFKIYFLSYILVNSDTVYIERQNKY